MVQKTHKHRPCISLPVLLFKYKYRITERYSALDEQHAFALLAMFDIQYLFKEWLDKREILYPCIETRHENRDRLGP